MSRPKPHIPLPKSWPMHVHPTDLLAVEHIRERARQVVLPDRELLDVPSDAPDLRMPRHAEGIARKLFAQFVSETFQRFAEACRECLVFEQWQRRAAAQPTRRTFRFTTGNRAANRSP